MEYDKEPKPSSNKGSLRDWLIIIGIVVFVGFTFLPVLSNPGILEGEESVKVNILEQTLWFNSATVKFQTYNEGFWTANNVKVKVSLITDSGNFGENHNKLATGDVLASETVYVGSLKRGEAKTNEVRLYLDTIPEEEEVLVSIKVIS